jgi:hypothetical protein
MLKSELYILDNIFSHAHSSSWYNKPTEFKWVRDKIGDHIVMTDTTLKFVDNINGVKKFAWLLESPAITPHAYEYIKDNFEKFDKIFTFDKELLNLSEKFVLVPIGGCWIEEENRIIHEKTKDASIILSAKKSTYGHRLRHEIAFSDVIDNLDVYGFNNQIKNKSEGLKDYRYSVIIENIKKDYYFTEKLIDCLITGTIPIYWGCPSIGEFFDLDGFIIFDDINDLKKIKNTFTLNNYFSKLEVIKTNYELAKKYLIADDLIYKKINNND